MSSPVASEVPDGYRLPTDVKPIHYDIIIKTDLESLTFKGLVRVDIEVKEPTSRIVLNSSDLDLGEATLYSDALKTEQVPTERLFKKTVERTTYIFKDTLPAGSRASLKIFFEGELTGNMTGYYKSSYEKDGKTKYYALTQLAPTAARRAFPCWDEPLLKATFTITLISRAGTVSLSNMPVASEEIVTSNSQVTSEGPNYTALFSGFEDGAWKVTKFETTPPMSSYLVAYANGHFEYLEDSVVLPLSGNAIPLRIYATADNIHQTKFALDVKKAVLPLYEKVFDVGYPLPKLDTLVVSDFDAGAMENWGLITGRTSAFLLDPEKAVLQAKKNVARIQTHEVAHMWFGNITTMEWWNYLYLNEGFATLMGDVIITVFPEWKMDSVFITRRFNEALNLDAQHSSHPIEVDCPDANSIDQIFDGLSYSKAASVLRMLSNFVGEDRFLNGVSIYLKKNLYANSVTNDLWEGVGTATGIDIPKVMDNWVEKIGFPVLTVTETSDGICVRQDRFLETGKGEGTDNETIWNVPLCILTIDNDGKAQIHKESLLVEREQVFKIDTSKPFKLNAGTKGVYRVLYTPERLTKIANEAVKANSVFALNDRLGLVFDYFALSKAGLAQVSSALTLVDLLGRQEEEYLVWSGIGENVSDLISIWWEHQQVVDQLNALRRSLFVPLVERLGYTYHATDTDNTIMLRTLAINQAADADDPVVVKELKDRFDRYLKTGDDSCIPADLQRITFITTVRYGGRTEYDAIVRIHNKSGTPTETISAILAMGATHNAELLKETLEFAGEKAREQDMMHFFRGLSTNLKYRKALTQYFKDRHDTLVKQFGGIFILRSLVSESFGFLSTEEDLKETEEFFKDKDTSKYNEALRQCLDGIHARIQYLKHSTTILRDWLQKWQDVTAC